MRDTDTKLPDREDFGLAVAAILFVVGVLCLLAAAVWWAALDPTPERLAVVGLGVFGVAMTAFMITLPAAAYDMPLRFPVPPPPMWTSTITTYGPPASGAEARQGEDPEGLHPKDEDPTPKG